MSDEKNQANADSAQPKPNNVGEVEVVEVEVVGRLRRARVEIRVPLGIAVSSASGRDCTRIVLLGFVGDERQGSHGDADKGI